MTALLDKYLIFIYIRPCSYTRTWRLERRCHRSLAVGLIMLLQCSGGSGGVVRYDVRLVYNGLDHALLFGGEVFRQ
jgi:hypothetical protein